MQLVTKQETIVRIGNRGYQTELFIELENGGGNIPVVELKQISDLAWQKLALKSRQESPELYGEGVMAEIDRIKATIAKMEK